MKKIIKGFFATAFFCNESKKVVSDPTFSFFLFPLRLILFISILSSSSVFAITIKVNGQEADPNQSVKFDFDIEIPCDVHDECGVRAHYWTRSISFDDNKYFDNAFDAWNANNPTTSKWTKVDGGALDATLNIQTFDAKSFHNNHGVGGLDIRVLLDYEGDDRDDFIWSQGLWSNYTVTPTEIVDPFYEMDVSTSCDSSATKIIAGSSAQGNVWCGPAYPFQYTDERFFDAPRAPYDSGFFEADAMLTKIDYTKRELTVYEGIHYGFSLYAVSEPNVNAFIVIALIWIIRLKRKQNAREKTKF